MRLPACGRGRSFTSRTVRRCFTTPPPRVPTLRMLVAADRVRASASLAPQPLRSRLPLAQLDAEAHARLSYDHDHPDRQRPNTEIWRLMDTWEAAGGRHRRRARSFFR